MTAASSLVRLLRPVTDSLPVFSFNRAGFEANRRGFDEEDLSVGAAGRTALVTGANSGIGLATSYGLARLGFDVWMLCRDEERGREARDAVAREVGEGRVHLAIVDMSDLASIRQVVGVLPAKIDVLIHNAGVLPDQKQLTQDGIELTFATHVVGPYALTGLLLERLRRSDDARVIFVASGGLYLQRLDLSLPDVDAAHFDGTLAYANAKRAQLVLARVLGERLPGLTFATMHPGWADTKAVRASLPKFHAVMGGLLRTAEQGADTVVWLAASDRPKGRAPQLWFDRRPAAEYPVPWTREAGGAGQALDRLCERKSGVTMRADPDVG